VKGANYRDPTPTLPEGEGVSVEIPSLLGRVREGFLRVAREQEVI